MGGSAPEFAVITSDIPTGVIPPVVNEPETDSTSILCIPPNALTVYPSISSPAPDPLLTSGAPMFFVILSVNPFVPIFCRLSVTLFTPGGNVMYPPAGIYNMLFETTIGVTLVKLIPCVVAGDKVPPVVTVNVINFPSRATCASVSVRVPVALNPVPVTISLIEFSTSDVLCIHDSLVIGLPETDPLPFVMPPQRLSMIPPVLFMALLLVIVPPK